MDEGRRREGTRCRPCPRQTQAKKAVIKGTSVRRGGGGSGLFCFGVVRARGENRPGHRRRVMRLEAVVLAQAVAY